MKLLNKILLATDFSETSEKAMEQSISVAKKFNSSIVILHVIPSMELTKLNREMIEKGVKQQLDKIRDRISAEGVSVEGTIMYVGIPFLHIIQEAEKQNVNVIIMGSRSKSESGGRQADMLGITAEKVLYRSAKPVWIVSQNNPGELQNILCPVDFSKPSERALKNAIHLARNMRAKLRILHVVPTVMDLYLRLLGGSEEKRDQKLRLHEEKMNKFLNEFDFNNVTYETVVKSGKVHKTIIEMATQQSIDLIVMGTSGESDNSRVLMGSNTEYVLRELPSSIISVKSESVIRPMIDYQISDLQSHYELGIKFLENGMPKEAEDQFKYCVDQDVLFAPAWEGLADAHERLGFSDSASDYRQKAKTIRANLWQKRVEAELRSKHKTIGNN